MAIRMTHALAGLLAAMLLAACSSNPAIKAFTDYNEAFDFSAVQTIGILPVDRADAEHITVSDMQAERIDRALAAELRSKGYEIIADHELADLQMTWHLVLQQRTDVRAYNSSAYYNCWRCGPSVSDVTVQEYTEGSFIVDMIDPARNRSVWRSVIQSRLREQPDPSGSAERRTEAARAIFAAFPPS